MKQEKKKEVTGTRELNEEELSKAAGGWVGCDGMGKPPQSLLDPSPDACSKGGTHDWEYIMSGTHKVRRCRKCSFSESD